MSTEDEFTRWLRRPEKTFLESLEFALKAWKSADLTLSSKYEILLKWVTEEGTKLSETCKDENEFPKAEFIELLQLRAQPGLIEQQTKREFVEMILSLSKIGHGSSRMFPDLLQCLSGFELLQDLFRFDYELHARVNAAMLEQYEIYLQQLHNQKLQPTYESEFFAAIMNSLKESAKRAGDVKQFDQFYSFYTLQPLVQVLLRLRKHALCFFEELVALERLLTEQYTEQALLERIMGMQLHLRLLTLECAIANRRGVETFLQLLLKNVFQTSLQIEKKRDPALALTVAAYTLEMLRKHDVSLNFKIGDQQSALGFLGVQLLPCVQKFKKGTLREVLLLLCAALRLNPLILEQNIFQVTTWMIVAEKTEEVQPLFDEFLVLLMDMFRRLSRAEKLVFNLLKILKEWLAKFQLPDSSNVSKKRQSEALKTTPAKKQKLNENFSPTDSVVMTQDGTTNTYLELIFQDLHKSFSCAKYNSCCTNECFPHLKTAWPSSSVGVAFSKLITGLVSKPSLVIWKSLLYSLKELLEQLKQESKLTENSLFILDLHAALLSQYFAGSRLSEQSDKFIKEITGQLYLTAEVLGQFGKYLLSRVHHTRTMNAFLECIFHVANFKLLLVYYRPDGFDAIAETISVDHLHNYLTEEEWTLIQQRVLNFGKSSCKLLLNRLLLQRLHAKYLLNPCSKATLSVENTSHKMLLSSACNDQEQLELLLKTTNVKWVIANLRRDEKAEICKELLSNQNLHSLITDDLECLELLTIATYERICQVFAANSKNSLLASLNCDFEELRRGDGGNNAVDKCIQQLVNIINGRIENYTLKKYPKDEAEEMLTVLQKLPIGHLRRQIKSLVFALHLTFYADLKAAGANEQAQEAFDVLRDLLHFGQHIPIFKYFSTDLILKLLPIAICWEFYEFLFASVKNDEKGTEAFLKSLTDVIKNAQAEGKLNDDYRRLILIAIEALALISGPSAKRMHRHLDALLQIYSDYVNAHFALVQSDEIVNSKKDKKFVEKTLAGFAHYASALLTKSATKPALATGTTAGGDQDPSPVNENFRRICKIYIGYSMDYRNSHAIRLMQVALNHRQQLHLDQDEIEFVLSNYWRQLNTDLTTAIQPSDIDKTTEAVVKMIIGNKTNEDLLLTLKGIGENVNEAKNVMHITRLLSLIAKCPFSTIKGAIFNEHFKQITSNLIIHQTKNEHQQFTNYENVLSILAAQQSIIENKMIPISIDTMDRILAFLMDINIKKFPITDANTRDLHTLHLAMSAVCTALVKQRHILLMDRVPQFMHIFKDLLQSIVWYKSERQRDIALTAVELDHLSELASKMEALMHIVATHSIHVKRVAPFVLTFVINLMVANKRPTTLYQKIKTHIESICYDLIGVCDHRVGRFLLRCSNDAARQVYQLLVKDHTKYHKFKGKV